MTIDERADAAGRRLRAEVDATVDTEVALAQVLAAPSARTPRRWPVLAAAAVLVTVAVAGALVVQTRDDGAPGEVAVDMDHDDGDDGDGDGDGRDAEGEREQLGVPLQLAGPTDGRQTLQLPIVAAPATDLADGATVHVTGSGFVAGESVGIVQCTNDAGAPHFAGIDACDISPFTSATADEAGNIVGDIAVQRFLTVPLAGTVDCAEAPGRCIVAAGALNNYDRSGGTGLTFAGAEPGLVLPTVTVSPTAALADGSEVHVSGTGFIGREIGLQICSDSPATCWSAAPKDRPPSIAVDRDGSVSDAVQVWRFLPGPTPGTYVDCAVSRCVLRFTGERAPAPVPLDFRYDDQVPQSPLLQADPAAGLAPGSTLTVRGSGFRGSLVAFSLCASQPVEESAPTPGVGSAPQQVCIPFGRERGYDVEDGSFEVTEALGAFDAASQGCATGCEPTVVGPNWTITLDVWVQDDVEDDTFGAPKFPAAPVVLGYTP